MMLMRSMMRKIVVLELALQHIHLSQCRIGNMFVKQHDNIIAFEDGNNTQMRNQNSNHS